MVQRRIKIAYINSRFIPVSSIYVSAIFRHMKFIEVEKKKLITYSPAISKATISPKKK